MAQEKTIHINVKMDERLFRDFAWFHTVTRPHKLPIYAAFFVFMGGVAGYLLWRHWWIPAAIVLAMAVTVPALRGWNYAHSMTTEIAAQGLRGHQRPVYTVELSAAGIVVRNSGERGNFAWDSIFAVYRRADVFYLYATKGQCFILPFAQFQDASPDEVWALCQAAAPTGCCKDLNHGKNG